MPACFRGAALFAITASVAEARRATGAIRLRFLCNESAASGSGGGEPTFHLITSPPVKTIRSLAFTLLTLLAAAAPERALATADYVYHEHTANDPGIGGQYVNPLAPTAAQSVEVRFQVEFQFSTDQARVYYTTDGSAPAGAFGVPTGTTAVLTGAYIGSFEFLAVTDVISATIPAQTAGTTVKYIVSAWHSGGGAEIFGNSGEFSSPFTTSGQANVFTYTVAVPDIAVIAVEGLGIDIPSGGTSSFDRGQTKTFTILNSGTATLNLGTIGLSGAGSTQFVLNTTGTSTTLAPGATTTFTVNFLFFQTEAGTFTVPLTIASDDPDENPFTLNVSGTVAPPMLEVRNAAGFVAASGFTFDTGSQVVGTTSGLKFISVRNKGDLPLTISGALVSGDTGDFTAAPPSSIPAGEFTGFVVRFSPTAAGTRTATLRLTSNDPTANPFDVVLTGTGLGSEIDLSEGGVPIADGGATSFGAVNVGSTSTKTFTITNTGTDTLTLGAVTKDGSGASAFTVNTTGMAASLAPSATTTLSVTFTPTSGSSYAAAIHLTNNDSNENPYDINLSGSGIAPEITVSESGTSLVDGTSTVDFGSANVTKTFTVANVGSQQLTLTAPTVDGANASEFTVNAKAMATSLAPNETTTFTVTSALTKSVGPRTAAVHLGSNDGDENPFDIALTASVSPPTNLLVDEAGDVNDGDYSTGHLTLREAIALANSDSAANTITFAPALDGTPILLVSALPAITQAVTITGRGADKTIIDAQQTGRVFTIDDGSTGTTIAVALSDLTARNGLSAVGQNGGGIINAENLTLRRCAITGNRAQGPGNQGGPFGGGVFSSGALTMDACEVSGNVSDSVGGGVFIGGTATATNSTISGNSALTAGGFGVAALGGGPASATVVNCTVVSNTGSAAPFGTAFGGLFSYGAALTLHNNLVAGNLENGSPGDLRTVQGGSITAATNNLIADPASAGGLTHGVDGNILGNGAGSLLPLADIASALANNGGATKTHALATGSPALDAGSNSAASGLTTDQRGAGYSRVVSGTVDIGAFELGSGANVVQLPDIIVTSMGQAGGERRHHYRSSRHIWILHGRFVCRGVGGGGRHDQGDDQATHRPGVPASAGLQLLRRGVFIRIWDIQRRQRHSDPLVPRCDRGNDLECDRQRVRKVGQRRHLRFSQHCRSAVRHDHRDRCGAVVHGGSQHDR